MLACLLAIAVTRGDVQVVRAEHRDVSTSLGSMPVLQPRVVLPSEEPESFNFGTAVVFDPVRQLSGARSMPAPLLSFDGIGPGIGFSSNASPPDANGDVGPNHYVQTTNFTFAVFSKAGALLYGPAATRTLFQGFGGGCEQADSGDPQALYDGFADRWIVMYMSWSYADGVSRQCLAVSRTGDPMGAYARYAFTYATNTDYSKLGVWPPGAYVFTTQLPQQASTPLACAFDRQRMIAGLDAVQQCLPLPVDRGQNSYPVPVDVDGRAPPPAGSSAYLVTAPVWNDLGVFRLHVDWSDPSRSSLSPRQSVTVAPWNPAASALAVTQPRTTQGLTAGTGWLRHRLAYRNFADHEALVVAHTVDVSGTIGIRWYELRPDGSGGLRVEQQGTFSPDGHHRFVPSAAMDARGNLALGYSVSSDVVYPSIRYAARLANDPLGTLTMAEGSLLEGTESQTNSVRWGDYSAMQVDPTDDCTFWYTTEYIAKDVATRIGAFRLPGCAGTDEFSISIDPLERSVEPGGSVEYALRTRTLVAVPEKLDLSAANVPAGLRASILPAAVVAGGSASLTISAGAGATILPPTAFTVTATGAFMQKSGLARIGVVAKPDFTISLQPARVDLSPGHRASLRVATAATGKIDAIRLGATALPPGVSASIDPSSLAAGDSATLTLVADAAARTGTFTSTITGSAALGTRSAALEIDVRGPDAGQPPISGNDAGQALQAGAGSGCGCSTSPSPLELLLWIPFALAARRLGNAKGRACPWA